MAAIVIAGRGRNWLQVAQVYGRSLASVRGNEAWNILFRADYGAGQFLEPANSGAGDECNRPTRPRSDGVRRGDRRRRAGGPRGRDQAQTDHARYLGGGGGEGLGGRGAHSVWRRDRSDRA